MIFALQSCLNGTRTSGEFSECGVLFSYSSACALNRACHDAVASLVSVRQVSVAGVLTGFAEKKKKHYHKTKKNDNFEISPKKNKKKNCARICAKNFLRFFRTMCV